jgi:hypothetical protein
MLFDSGYEIAAYQEWMGAYPVFDPPENFPPFQLSQGLYYANAWENAASAMEMAALGGRNVALLTAQYLNKETSSSNNLSEYSDVQLSLGSDRLLYRKTGGDAAAAAAAA